MPADTQTAPARSARAVTVAAPRLPYDPGLNEKYGIDQGKWRVLIESVFPSAQSFEGVSLALAYCKARQLDIFKRPVHVVPIWNSKLRKVVESVWPGINELRSTAFRTGEYAGCEPSEFGPLETKTFVGSPDPNKQAVSKTVTYPTWCRITVYRLIAGNRVPFPGPTVYWLSAYGRVKQTELPNDKWETDPSYMLEKCTEAAALRKAFPEALGGWQAVEELRSNVDDGPADIVVEETTAPARPTRDEYVQPTQDGQVHQTEENAGSGEPVTNQLQDTTETFPLLDEDGEELGHYSAADWPKAYNEKGMALLQDPDETRLAKFQEANAKLADQLVDQPAQQGRNV